MDSDRFFFDASFPGNMFQIGNREPILRGTRSLFNLEKASKKPPFFSFPDERIDEEYFEEQFPEKKRRLTPDQIHLLEKSFETEKKLESERKNQIAMELGLQPRQVAVWFQNRRARWKLKQLERDYDLLKASYESLLSNYDFIINENEKLKFEVVSLNEKVEAKEVAGGIIDGELFPAGEADVLSVQLNVITEDHLSCESGRSAMVDEDGLHTPYLPEYESGDGRSYFPVVFADTEQQYYEEREPLEWWVWSSNDI